MNLIIEVAVLVSTQMTMLIYTKRATDREPLPLFLCLSQFIVSATLAALTILARKGESSSSLWLPQDVLVRRVLPLALCWTLGFVLFYASASLTSPALVSLVRCMEPLATVALGYYALGKRYSRRVLATLIPICGGVALSSSMNGNLSIAGAFLACLSNISFCGRPYLMQKLKNDSYYAHQKRRNFDICVFFNVSLISAVLLPAVVILWEGISISRATHRLIEDGGVSFVTDVMLSSLCFFLYQFTQLRVMSHLNPLAFSVLTPVIKAIMIVACSFYFGDAFGLLGLIGVAMTTGGGYLFTVDNASEQEGAAQTRLPLTMRPVNHSSR